MTIITPYDRLTAPVYPTIGALVSYAGPSTTKRYAFKLQTVGGDRDLVMALGESADLAIVGVQRANATFPLSVYLA